MTSDSERLEALVAECLEQLEAGGEAALEAFLNNNAGDAAALRERLDALRALGVFGADAATHDVPEELGDFRIIRRLGAGGMGVVYLAEQRSLRREVALKLIRPEHLYFPGALDRFRREVETAASLQHEGIVPIFIVGKEKGIPYYAMERVAGCSLADALRALAGRRAESLNGGDLATVILQLTPGPTASGNSKLSENPENIIFQKSWIEACLHIIKIAARTLDYVHERGIVHRDLKPSNMMITPAGRVMLVDFGLASAQGASRLTRSGSELGSLPYMAPEQIRGESQQIDARSDVYGLGVSLYELLTLQLPFAADSAETTRGDIIEGRFAPPRSKNSNITKDVETVCLKAMATERGERYASAGEFAVDLQNLLEHRPILARPASVFVKFKKWTRRRPAAAAAVLLALLLVIGIPAALMLQNNERERARADFAASMDAVDQTLTILDNGALVDAPHTTEMRRELLQKSLAICLDFLKRHENDPAARGQAADAHYRLGRVHYLSGDSKKAMDSYNSAIQLFDDLTKDGSADVALPRGAVGARLFRGHLYIESGDFKSAEADLLKSLAAAVEGYKKNPGDAPSVFLLVDVQSEYCDLLRRTGRPAEARKAADEVLEWVASLLEKTNKPEVRVLQARARMTSGYLYEDAKNYPAAEAAYRGAVESMEACEGSKGKFTVRDHLGRALQSLAVILLKQKDPARGAELFERALAVRRALCNDFPSASAPRTDLTACLTNLALLRAQRKEFAEAQRMFEECAQEFKKIMNISGETPDLLHSRAGTLNNLGRTFMERKLYKEAIPIFEEALADENRAIVKNTKNARYREFAGQQVNNLVRSLLGVGRFVDAVAAAERLYQLPEQTPDDAFLAASYLCLCLQYAETGAVSAGETDTTKIRDRAITILREVVAKSPALLANIQKFKQFEVLKSDARFQELISAK